MTGYELKLWRRGMNWTQERAAEEFGISLATYKRYEKGEPPRVIEMAIRVLSFDDMVKDLSHLDKDAILLRLQTLVWERLKCRQNWNKGSNDPLRIVFWWCNVSARKTKTALPGGFQSEI